MCRNQVIRNAGFSENFAYVINELMNNPIGSFAKVHSMVKINKVP